MEGDSILGRPGRASGSRRWESGWRGWVGRSRSGAALERVPRLWLGFPWGTVLQIPDVDDAFPHGVDHRLGSVEDVQLPVDVGGVVAYRLLRDAQRTCYLPVAHALGQRLYDFEFPLCQRRSVRGTLPWPAALEGV